MTPNKESIKYKITHLDYEIKLLENNINEMVCQRTIYKQYYEKCSADKNDS